eukprot:89115-Pelagomonas_calceolata.AAC.3
MLEVQLAPQVSAGTPGSVLMCICALLCTVSGGHHAGLMFETSLTDLNNKFSALNASQGADEAAALEAYVRSGKPASDLADPDRVLLEMQSIPYVEARLRCYAHKFAAPHKLNSASQAHVLKGFEDSS